MPGSARQRNSHEWAEPYLESEERLRVFKQMGAQPLAKRITLTTERKRRADLIFNSLELPGYKWDLKRRYWARLYQSLLQAHCQGTAVMFSRRTAKKVELQVIDAAVSSGYAKEIRSKPGFSDHCSRLLPTEKLIGAELIDPWTVEPNAVEQFVYVKERRKDEDRGEEIAFDPTHPIAAKWQRRLELINSVNGQFRITYNPYRPTSDDFASTSLQLRPVHYASFVEDFTKGGRIYTGKYGHQGLLKIERRLIRFDGDESIELDFSGLHPRMLYHLEGIDYGNDPYALWGEDTTKEMRELAKVYINALINAKSPESARDACNFKMRQRTKSGDWRTGKAYRVAVQLHGYSKHTGIKFGDLHPIVMQKHQRIAHRFGCDMGIELMRMDAVIALNVMNQFARKGIPCLGVHDSFIVPKRHEQELRETMMGKYAKKVGFMPLVD
jgi:hypothetical protein